jgi:predicted alpha/beta-hydrolase family hydrolase
MTQDVSLRFHVSDKAGEVSALLRKPPNAQCLYVLAHGAGAGMQHRFMQAITDELTQRGIATFRYQFPYMEAGRRRPDHHTTLTQTVQAAIEKAAEHADNLPIFAGGKSMGGRMTSRLLAQQPIGVVRGLVFLGFPLHPPGKPGVERGDHLEDVKLPMLFLQGTRDKLAELELLKPVCSRISDTTLHIVEGADHGFDVLKRSGRTGEEVLGELASTIREWCFRVKDT